MPLIFFHLSRTGGNTLKSQVFKRQFKDIFIYRIDKCLYRVDSKTGLTTNLGKFDDVIDDYEKKIKFFTGHMPFGLHKHFSSESIYFTLLRDPLGVIVSRYYAISKDKRKGNFEVLKDMTLKDYVESGANSVNNLQTRILSDNYGLPEEFAKPLPPNALDVAKSNLKKFFKVVGVSNRFDETLLVLKKTFGWRNAYYIRVNTTRQSRPSIAEIPDEIVKIVEKNNRLDTALFNFAEEMLDNSIKACGPSFEKDLKRFKRINTFYQKTVYPAGKKGKKFLRKLCR